jgi:hypothetical protein
MINSTHKTKRGISTMLMVVFVMGLASIGLFGIQNQAFAQDTEQVSAAAETVAGAAEGACVGVSPGTDVCPATGAKNALKTVGEKILSPVFRIALITALLNLAQFVLDRIAYEAAVAIASGGSGQDSMFYKTEPADAFANLGLEIAGEAVGALSELGSDELGLKFNLCDPSAPAGGNPLLGLAMSIGIKQKYEPEEPKCDILEVGANWEGFIGGAITTITDPEARQEAILGKFAESLKPGKNELDATLQMNIAVDQEVKEQKLLQFMQRNESDYKNVTDFVSGNVKTPSDTLQKDFESSLAEVDGDQSQINVGELVNAKELIGGLALTTASTFANTLLSQLMNKIYTGLFDDDEEEFDPFNIEALSGTGRESAQARFASILATNPIQTTEYNALSEFVVCPPQGVSNRGPSNCVMDTNFLTAVVRGNSGSPLTVQEAIDEGFISGDWKLIGPDELSTNQDLNCFNYAFCYGNLVKLRKARVIPIGWELAAFRNRNGAATLQEIIDGFDTCTESGDIGPTGTSTQWCHLIDPNWVLKYPDAQCRALVNGEIRISPQTNGRLTYCADAPSCIGEDNDGNCSDGYGYCVEEKNIWRFRGDECPQEFASCLSFENTVTGESADYLVNTVDYSVCGQDNAGCRWYRTQKYFDDLGTELDESDDDFVWLPTGDDYTVADRDDDWAYLDATTSLAASRASYSYSSGTSLTNTYNNFAYEDRIYLTHDAVECDDADGGCTQLHEFADTLVLNSVVNPSFEDDDDSDGFPDNWNNLASSGAITTAESNFGSSSFLSSTSTLQQFVYVTGNNFYTLSFYSQVDVASSSNTSVTANLLDEDGLPVLTAGTSYDGDCTQGTDSYNIVLDPSDTTQFPLADEWYRFECTFTTPATTDLVEIYVVSPNIYLDSFQLELGEDANGFTTGYSFSSELAYYKVAPDYLGCTGNATDPAACDDYAQACTAQEVGCSLYIPDDGDPSVPAIISSLDECPSSCVGYTTYKQEATDREAESFPLYFIASSASSCTEQSVGCDAFTSLAAVGEGGEGTEYFTDTRSCLTEAIADGSAANKTPATFFTWEGSDNAGYQLMTWYLLSSNYTGSTTQFNPVTGSGFTEVNAENAPCTHISMTSENVVVCDDNSGTAMIDDVWDNDECDEHDDIFDNPDCREYFDPLGEPHYRLHSMTISVDDACTPYRMDDSNQTDCLGSGGFWADQGFCRYYVLASESSQCSASQSGCREFTGGSGRNSTTILDENFEGGTYEDYVFMGTVQDEDLAISNESVATDGHSFSVTNTPSTGTGFGFETVQIYLNSSAPTATYDVDIPTTCTSVGGSVSDAGCDVEKDTDSDGTADMSCTIADGQESCGTLTDTIVAGKTFVLDFWAKGSGDLYVAFVEEGGGGAAVSHDMVDAVDATTTTLSIDLSGNWQLYSLGPLDTSDFDDFDENAILQFYTDGGDVFYIDNISLKQTEENVTVIKDSWIVPSVCDQTPSGADSDQYYLGCEAYTDHNGNDADLYQFTNICNEEVVGCEGFFNTHNSESEFTEVFNARCIYTDSSLNTDLTDGEVVTSNTDCVVGGETLCTIIVGTSYCTFTAEKTFETPLPVEGDFGIVYGPETRFVRSDEPVYMVVNDGVACGSSVMGCTEFGEPTYNQTQTEVTEFESKYFIDLPASYDDILCDHQALFCEEWASNESGNFYFKHPLDKSCEYKNGVPLGNQSYLGWFRSGTTEPCYWTDEDGDGEFDISEDSSIIEDGDTFKAWRNGDDGYDGWVAQCDSQYNLCSEFVDVVDTGAAYSYGQSYYFTNDELLDDEAVRESQRCEGRVSQKQACALFYNTTNSDLSYNASASYVTSIHADVFFGETQNDLVDPVTCEVEGAAVYEISESDAEFYGVEGGLGSGFEDTVDLCMRRCGYVVDEGDYIETSTSELYTNADSVYDAYFERSCLGNTDCPVLTTYEGEEVSGICTNVWEASDALDVAIVYSMFDPPSYTNTTAYKLGNDTNEILKVDRDRSCSAWLACDSSKTSWNSSTNTYDRICDSIDLCIEGRLQGEETVCTNWESRDVEILTTADYATRDVTWNGFEYSGNTIPNQLPIESYNQFNVAAVSYCVEIDGETPRVNENNLPEACDSFTDCAVDLASPTCTIDSECTPSGYGGCDADGTGQCFYACENSTELDYRLVYKAGECDSSEPVDDDGDGIVDRGGVGNGGSCRVGLCGGDGIACDDDDDCSDEECVVGYCQAQADTSCPNSDCSCNPDSYTGPVHSDCVGATSGSVSTPICDPRQYVCVDVLTDDEDNRDSCVQTDDCGSQQVCVPSSTSTVGSCFNNQCLTDITDNDGNGLADPLYLGDARTEACRGYPEFDSPFPVDVVSTWRVYTSEYIGDNDTHPDVTSFVEDAVGGDLGQSSSPYSFLNGFQDAFSCSLDNNGEPVECECSYDKVEYGNQGGAGIRYFSARSEFPADADDEIPIGICAAGSFTGIACIDDDDCSLSTDDVVVKCEPLTQVSTLYGWEGYCIERDTSIQTLGSPDNEDQACLSWLPIDQLAGATDLYAKFTSAGYSPQDTYYCADIDIAYNVGTTPMACAEVQDNNCNDGSWLDFKNEAKVTSASSGQDDCTAAAWCPDGFFGVMTGCGAQAPDDGEMCSGGDWDCPFICVPKLSYKTEQDDDIGEPCLPPTELSALSSLTWSGAGGGDDENVNPWYYKVSEVYDHWSNDTGYWNDYFPGYGTNAWFYVLQRDDFETAYSYYNDCLARGVLSDLSEDDDYPDPPGGHLSQFLLPMDSIGELPHEISAGHVFSGEGFRDLSYSFNTEAVCTSLVQVSTKTLAEDDSLPFDTYNAAYTDRLWQTDTDRYTITGAASDDFGYSNSTGQAQFGKATDYQIIEDLIDPFPHRVVACVLGLDKVPGKADPAVSCDAGTISSSSGDDARAYQAFQVGYGQISTPTADYCKNGDCDCLDGGSLNDEWCAWDPSYSGYVECGGPSHTGECTISEVSSTDSTPLGCSIDNNIYNLGDLENADCNTSTADGDYCVSVCDGGTYNGTSGGIDEYRNPVSYCVSNNDCTDNYCYGIQDYGSSASDDYIYGVCVDDSDSPPGWWIGDNDNELNAIARLSQLFGRLYGMVAFTDDGYGGIANWGRNDSTNMFDGAPYESWTAYDFEETEDSIYDDWVWNNRYEADGDVPHIAAVGSCNGSKCQEGAEDSFTIDEATRGTIEAVESYRASASFFAYADSDHMPIRRIVVDWGDDFTSLTGDQPWSTGSQSGSDATDNFYKNHRGTNPTTNLEICTSEDDDEFGNSPRACSSSYLTYTHDYTCSPGQVNDLELAGRTCVYEDDRLINSPCESSGACVFQPRIHVMDNWGWCTGFCDSESADTGEECYSGLTSTGAEINECDIENCPGGGSSVCDAEWTGLGLSNPWINWGGTIAVLPE